MTDNTQIFSSKAEDYSIYRPGHPPKLVARVAERLDLRWGDPILDVGSGTGIFSKQLEDICGGNIWNVEPDKAMRSKDKSRGVKIAGEAKKIMLPNRSIKAITISNALHWFADEANDALKEFCRVLRPNGSIIILSHMLDQQAPLTKDLHALFLENCPNYKETTTGFIEEGPRKDAENFISKGRVGSDEETCTYQLSSEDFLGWLRTLSFFPEKNEATDLIKNLTKLFSEHEKEGYLEISMKSIAHYGCARRVETLINR